SFESVSVMLWALPLVLAWESKMALVLASMSMLASVSDSVTAIRFRSSPLLQRVFPLPVRPSEVSVQSHDFPAALMALPHFLSPRDLQRHLTKGCSPHLLTPWLPRSSESAPRSELHVRARLM